ncbi:hypothetical protein DPMN_061972 [Dreissena polymorpha]|uniref:Uncharacterized protein n=1 Tax=Dreissena polymorpha TaxID=45954 RepID=A0A9D4C7Z4_DREPO|nr:hypothetical protein DPMN_061972 [Dreissena polymorpha]
MDRDRFLETCREVLNSITRILETNRSLEVINSSLTRLDALARNVNRMTTSYPEFTPTRQFQGSDCKRRNSLPMSEILFGVAVVVNDDDEEEEEEEEEEEDDDDDDGGGGSSDDDDDDDDFDYDNEI